MFKKLLGVVVVAGIFIALINPVFTGPMTHYRFTLFTFLVAALASWKVGPSLTPFVRVFVRTAVVLDCCMLLLSFV